MVASVGRDFIVDLLGPVAHDVTKVRAMPTALPNGRTASDSSSIAFDVAVGVWPREDDLGADKKGLRIS